LAYAGRTDRLGRELSPIPRDGWFGEPFARLDPKTRRSWWVDPFRTVGVRWWARRTDPRYVGPVSFTRRRPRCH